MKEVSKKVITMADKVVVYTHIYPVLSTKTKLKWRERLRVLFGVPLVLNLNIYLNNDKVVHTLAVLSTEISLRKAQKNNCKINSKLDE